MRKLARPPIKGPSRGESEREFPLKGRPSWGYDCFSPLPTICVCALGPRRPAYVLIPDDPASSVRASNRDRLHYMSLYVEKSGTAVIAFPILRPTLAPSILTSCRGKKKTSMQRSHLGWATPGPELSR